MDRELIEAAKKGDVSKLHNLINDYPLALRAAALADGETPLQVACMWGHVDFVRVVLSLRLESAGELNQNGFSPLHIASASGDVEIVKELLKVGSDLCLVKGKEKRIPLHYAASRGSLEVIRELLFACGDSIREVTARRETCFHLAVKNNRFEAFKALCEHVVLLEKTDILNDKDGQGNTVLLLASSRKQYEVFDLLFDNDSGCKEKLEVNSLNRKGQTPLDVLISEGGDSEIEEMLALSGATNLVIATEDPPNSASDQPKSAYKKLRDYFKYDEVKESPSKARNTLLVISILIVTATYQAVLSPPGGVWPENKSWSAKHRAGESVMASHNRVSYGMFLVFNSVGFFMSLHMINFLTYGFPLQFEITVAIVALAGTYNTCIIASTPDIQIVRLMFIVMSVLLPLMMPVLTKVIRYYNKGRWFS